MTFMFSTQDQVLFRIEHSTPANILSLNHGGKFQGNKGVGWGLRKKFGNFSNKGVNASRV